MKSRVKKLLFGSVTRELLLIIISSVFVISLLFDVIPRAITNMMPGLMTVNLLHIRLDIMLSILLGSAGILFVSSLAIKRFKYTKTISKEILDVKGYDEIKSKNKLSKLLSESEAREVLLNVLLVLISLRLFSNAITILILIYLLIRKKAKYIKNIYDGINKISQGNLDYKIEVKGCDELAALAKEINNMSSNLKNKIEEERAAERLKSELITNVSHDLRTPLTALIGYIQLAADDYMTFDGKDKYAKISLEKSKKLKMLIDDLFEYSKLESGGIKLEKVKVNIIEIIEQSIGELSIQAKEREIEFNKNYTSSKVELLVDPNQMARVFENIIENAVKYGVQGSNVNINLHENDEDVIISFENIVDRISEEDLEKIFNRFYRADESRNSEISGSGLGLAIAKSIVELHKGKIWAKSEDDKFVINIELNSKILCI